MKPEAESWVKRIHSIRTPLRGVAVPIPQCEVFGTPEPLLNHFLNTPAILPQRGVGRGPSRPEVGSLTGVRVPIGSRRASSVGTGTPVTEPPTRPGTPAPNPCGKIPVDQPPQQPQQPTNLPNRPKVKKPINAQVRTDEVRTERRRHGPRSFWRGGQAYGGPGTVWDKRLACLVGGTVSVFYTCAWNSCPGMRLSRATGGRLTRESPSSR